MLRLTILILALAATTVHGHGAVVSPPPRNAVDRDLAPWNGPVPEHPPSVESATGWCPVPGKDGKPSGENGQSCFWFSNGVSPPSSDRTQSIVDVLSVHSCAPS